MLVQVIKACKNIHFISIKTEKLNMESLSGKYIGTQELWKAMIINYLPRGRAGT